MMKSADKIPIMTSAKIEALEKEKRQSREKMTLYQQPLRTVSTFIAATYWYFAIGIKYCILHPAFLYICLPVFSVYGIFESFPQNPFGRFIEKVEFVVEFTIWWVGLGVLSSIGLGSGLQTGVLFLFPHIIQVCLAAQTCKTLDFESDSNMWFRSPPDLFQCPSVTPSSTPVTFFGIWKKLVLVCFFQAAGTAIGEIPPYWITRAARLAGIEAGTSESSDIPDELETSSDPGMMNKGKAWMIRFLRSHGFYGVLFLASFPNIAFDVCGIFCGHYLMPFWTFFSATFIGKAIIRNGYQSVIYIALCNERYLELIILILQRLAPDSLKIDTVIREVLEEGRDSFRAKNRDVKLQLNADEQKKPQRSYAATAMIIWQLVMTLFLLSFFVSCISQFAQHYQMTLDADEICKLRAKAAANASKQEAKVATPAGRHQVSSTPSAQSSTIVVIEPSKEAQAKGDDLDDRGKSMDMSKKRE